MDLAITLLNARALVIAEALNGGAIAFYSGPKPEPLSELSEQVELITLALPNPCYQEIVNGALLMQPLAEKMVQQSGKVSWARLFNDQGEVQADLSVSAQDGTGELTLPLAEAQLYQGAYLRLTDWSIV